MVSLRKRGAKRQASAKKRRRRPTSMAQYSKLSLVDQRRYDAALHVISSMRQKGASLSAAAREHGVTPKAVKDFAGSALRKTASGRYAAKGSDRLLRVLLIPGHSGPAEIAICDSRSVTVLGEYWNAVHLFLETGNDSELRRFRGKSVTTADGSRRALITNLDELERLGSAGVLSFESIYGRVG